MYQAVIPKDPRTPDPEQDEVPIMPDPDDEIIDDTDPLEPPIEEPDPFEPPVEEPPPGRGA